MRKIICMTVSCLLAMVLLCSTPIAIGMCEVKEAVAMSSVTKPTTREELLVPEDNDFLSRGSAKYDGINGKSVGIYTFYRDCNEPQNNPNFSQTLLIYQCIKYKEKYPEADVSIACSSFHFSVALSACVDDSKPDYGKMKNPSKIDYIFTNMSCDVSRSFAFSDKAPNGTYYSDHLPICAFIEVE